MSINMHYLCQVEVINNLISYINKIKLKTCKNPSMRKIRATNSNKVKLTWAEKTSSGRRGCYCFRRKLFHRRYHSASAGTQATPARSGRNTAAHSRQSKLLSAYSDAHVRSTAVSPQLPQRTSCSTKCRTLPQALSIPNCHDSPRVQAPPPSLAPPPTVLCFRSSVPTRLYNS